jgi:hypothetical protein
MAPEKSHFIFISWGHFGAGGRRRESLPAGGQVVGDGEEKVSHNISVEFPQNFRRISANMPPGVGV